MRKKRKADDRPEYGDGGGSDMEKTRSLLDEALRRGAPADPDDYMEMLARAAGAALEMGLLRDELRVLERGRTIARETGSARYSLAFARMECNAWYFQDRPDLALATHGTRCKDLPADQAWPADWWAHRIHYEARSGLLAEAQEHLDEYCERLPGRPRHPRMLMAEADLWLEAGELAKALACSDRAISSSKQWIPLTWGWEPRIRLLIGLGRIEEAEALAAEHGAAASPGHRVAARNPAVLSVLQATFALARGDGAALRRHVGETLAFASLRPLEKNKALFLLAQEALISGRSRAARVTLQRLDPDVRDWRYAAAWARLCLSEGNEAEARRHMGRLLDPRFPSLAAERLRWASELTAYQTARLLAPGGPSPAPAALATEPARAPARRSGLEWHSADVQLVGVSPALERIRGQIVRFAGEPAPVLITGETGTGKEVVATLLHREGPRAAAPLLPINCAALSGFLIESELFGHVRGAFSGATRDHTGVFLAAKKGTVLLDEVQALPLESQARLLRVLENGEVRPVGSSRARKCQARIIATTNQPLEQAVGENRFRGDLFYRLARLRIDISPLRERREDILPLARFFLSQFYEEFEVGLTHELIRKLQDYDYPGNVRDLRNRIERIAVFAGDTPVLDAAWLDPAQGPTASPSPGATVPTSEPLPAPVPVLPGGVKPGTEDRRDRLLELFAVHKRLTPKKVSLLFACAVHTASRDLAALEQRGLIRRVITSANLRTSYYERC
ncbi:MAG: sigma 54-interacting transcriptional regulator [Kiritimatiellae bacterium]|nr:sigma 54-interacting transcriptional regulator [Kiritimatiellia bacterium]